jgi:biopolymer transport protein ExbB
MRRWNELTNGVEKAVTRMVAATMLVALMPAAALAQEADEAPAMVIDVPQATSADDLLRKVREGFEVRKRENAEREARFKAARGEQQQMLDDAKAREKREEATSQALEKQYQENETKIAELEEALEQRMGNLGELFGVTRQIAGDTRGNVEASITTSQFGKERVEFLEELGKSKELPEIMELQRLWAEMLNEMNEQGKVVEYKAEVYTPNGIEERDVTRAGVFTVISGGEYLLWDANEQKLQSLSRQPPARFLGTISDYENGGEGLTGLAVDPSRGSLLAVLIETRGLVERLQQREGGAVGDVIIGLGSIAFLLGAFKMLWLFIVGRKVAAQKKNSRPDTGNPLGRVLAVAADNPDVDRE